MTAEVISQLLTDEDFVNELAKTDRNLVQRIFDIIADFFDKAIGRYTDNKSDMSAEMKEAIKELQNEFDNIKKMYNIALSSTEAKRGVNMKLPKKGGVMYNEDIDFKNKKLENNSNIRYSKNRVRHKRLYTFHRIMNLKAMLMNGQPDGHIMMMLMNTQQNFLHIMDLCIWWKRIVCQT